MTVPVFAEKFDRIKGHVFQQTLHILSTLEEQFINKFLTLQCIEKVLCGNEWLQLSPNVFQFRLKNDHL